MSAAPSLPRLLVTLGGLGLLLGILVTNLSTALLELDDGRGLGAACEHVEAALVGGPGGLLVGLAAAVAYHLARRRRSSMALAVLAASGGAVVALLVVDLLLYPLATGYLPIFVCAF